MKLITTMFVALMFSAFSFGPECGLHYESGFSPNGDNVNDTWEVTSKCSIEDYKVTIYDRWGKQVFSETDINKSWDGKKCKKGVYAFVIEVKFKNEATRTLSGNITLLK